MLSATGVTSVNATEKKTNQLILLYSCLRNTRNGVNGDVILRNGESLLGKVLTKQNTVFPRFTQ